MRALCRRIVDPLSADAYFALSRLRSLLASASVLDVASWTAQPVEAVGVGSTPWRAREDRAPNRSPKARTKGLRDCLAASAGSPERQRTRLWVGGLWPRQPPRVLPGSQSEAVGSACPPPRAGRRRRNDANSAALPRPSERPGLVDHVEWSLPTDYPMVAPNYAAQRSAFDCRHRRALASLRATSQRTWQRKPPAPRTRRVWAENT